MEQCAKFPGLLANFLQPFPRWMGIFDCVKCQFAITDHCSEHIRELMNQLACEPYRLLVIRILAEWLFILVFVPRQKPHSLLPELLIALQFRLHGRQGHAREMPC